MKKILFAIFAFVFNITFYGQNWVDKLSDPDVNFYEVQEAFNAHWGEKGYERGKGWKQYKRWEYFTEPRSYPSGNRQHGKEYLAAWAKIQKDEAFLPKSNNAWQPVGPFSWISQAWNPGLGRINSINVDPVNPNIIYVATPSGGLWKSTNGGSDWVCLTDNLPAIGASGLAIHPENTDVLYLATGDGDGSDSYSFGVLKSTDGGTTWETTSLIHQIPQQIRCTGIKIDPNNYDKLWVSSSKGLYVTEDGGLSWSLSLSDNIRDFVLKPDDSQVVYAAGRKFYKSIDGGLNFIQITDGVPSHNDVNRLALAVSEDNAEVVYFVAGASSTSGFYGLYRSIDAGESFSLMSNTPNILTHSQIGDGDGGQSWYDLAIVASPLDVNEIYVGGINVWKSVNAGASWQIKSHWVYPSSVGYTHADIHFLDFFHGSLYCGSDGGIYRSDNYGDTWIDLSDGLQISQYYKIDVSQTNPNIILTASQDNGTNLFLNDEYIHLLGGDGNMALINYNDDQIMYAAYPGGDFHKSTNGGQTFSPYSSGVDETGSWVTPLVFHPTNPNFLYAAFENVWRSSTSGIWQRISDFSFSGTLQTLRIAPSNPNVIYTSTYSDMRKTTNAGQSWSAIGNGLPNLAFTDIAVHPTNSEKIWVTLSGYDENSKVYYSENGGLNWQNITSNLPNIPINCISYQPGSNDALYIGTDAGVYYKDDAMINWAPYNTGLPNVIVNSIVFQNQTAEVYVGTYGRGVWKNEFFDPSAVLPVVNFESDYQLVCEGTEINFTNKTLHASENFVWTFEGGLPATSTEVNPTVIYNESGQFSVKLWAENQNGMDSLILENHIIILDTVGMQLPYSETFETANDIDDIAWFAENFDGLNSWEINHETGYNSSSSIWLNNFSKLPQNTDYLTSNTFNLANTDTAIVTMKVAYARKPSSSNETLKMYISNDCGETWIFKKTFGSNALATNSALSAPFIPTDTLQWQTLSIDNIEPHERTNNFRIQLRFTSNGGNNIYIDNINVLKSIPTHLPKRDPVFEKLSLFPNPAGESTTLQVTAQKSSKVEIDLYNAEGKYAKRLWDGKIQEGENTVSLSLKGLKPGIYNLSIHTKTHTRTEQLIIK